MDIRRELTTPCDTDRLFAWVEDLSLYPQWMGLIHQVSEVSEFSEFSGVGGVDVATTAPSWNVELRAHVGPFARSKVLRMERTEHVAPSREPGAAPGRVTFERSEIDGREHSVWTLRATVAPGQTEQASHLVMELQYGGSLWGGVVLQRVLDDAIRRASEQLVELVSDVPRR